ncbi:bifunctional metallophosphatase/5'-nucleotidase [Gorillibacterium timonense]|uniref:bifunctional metallophosphatase/5'-nucleotidase n=1 Tax=Gorillibacterium timonense TaxID=1689269 RepID=UPI00071DA1ED|nr:bifunctional UDP-sugar hydrolase/5'-nucleotidase [Gorillibacterium timonense]
MNAKATKRSYTPILVLTVLLLGVIGYLTYRFAPLEDWKLKAGFYDDKLAVINTADIHGNIVYNEVNGGYYTLDEVNVEMGMPLMKGVADELRAKNKNSLFLDSGDMFHGTNEANVDEAKGIVEVANMMGYDAMVAGNHDFDFGFKRMLEIKQELNYPILSGNTFYKGEHAFPSYIIKEKGGLKIGIFGLTVPDSLSNMNVFGEPDVSFTEPEAEARKIVAELQEQGVNAIVFVSHLGDDLDKELVSKVPGIDLVLCGHHHWLYKKAEKIGDTYLVEAGSYSTHVGLAELYFKNGKVKHVEWSIHQSKDVSKEDKAVAAVAEKYHAIALEKGKAVVGHSKVELDGMRTHVRTEETNLANLITDAMREEGKADLALLNGGGIRESISKGDITLYDVGKPLPFVNSLMTVEVEGEKIYEAIERGLRAWPYGSSNGGFLQVSGIAYTFDGSKPAGKRLVSVTMNDQPLDKEKKYKVATNDYLVTGGDNFTEFENAKRLSKGALLRDVLAAYLKEKGTVSPETEGRITVTNKRYK